MKLKHYLIASEQNDYKPWILTPVALAVFCLVIWSLRLIIPTTMTLAAGTIDTSDLMNRINQQRQQRFIPTLITNTKLINAANGKAKDMLARSYFAHIDPDGNYVWPRIEASGYTPYTTLGENLAIDFNSASDMVTAWMNSPTHRANIVNEKFQDQGLASIFGTYEPSHDTTVVVSLFGTLVKSKTSTATAKAAPPPPPAVIANPQPSKSSLKISNDVKVTTTSLSGHTLVNIDLVIAGSPTLVTAQLKTQSISMIAGKVAGEFIGSFTFDTTEDLSNQTLSVEARDKNNVKATLTYPINIENAAKNPAQTLPTTNEAQVIQILKIIFGIFATVYMGFLAIDAIIIHRAKIKREGVHTAPHTLVFLLVAAVSLFANWL